MSENHVIGVKKCCSGSGSCAAPLAAPMTHAAAVYYCLLDSGAFVCPSSLSLECAALIALASTQFSLGCYESNNTSLEIPDFDSRR